MRTNNSNELKSNFKDKFNKVMLSYKLRLIELWQNRLEAHWCKLKQYFYKSKEYVNTIIKKYIIPRIKRTSPMMLMLISVGILFGSIFLFQMIKGYLINKYILSASAPPAAVSSYEVKFEDWQPTLKASGSLRAVQGVDVTTEIAGLVRSIEFEPGAMVNAGDILIRLNDDAEVAQLHVFQAAAELAQINYTRDKEQYAIKAISKAVLDTDAADLKSKTAQVEQQLATIAKKTIRAPFSGRLGISKVNLGQYVNPGDKVVTLQALNPIYVDFYIPQQQYRQIQVNQTVSISSDAYKDTTFQGKITTIDPKVDSDTRNGEIEATIENSDHKLLPGMHAQTVINIGEPKKYLTLPQTAISYNPYGDLVYIIKEKGKDKQGNPILSVVQSFVTVGELRGDQVSILDGLKEGDIVVTTGQNKIRNGSIVYINNKVVPSNNPSPKLENE